MAKVTKCDNCGEPDSLENPVHRRHQTIHIRGNNGLTICVDLPARFNAKDAELCEGCIAKLVSARLDELCAMLAPYRPGRVPGFIQGVVVEEAQPELSDTEARQMLTLLSRKLLRS